MNNEKELIRRLQEKDIRAYEEIVNTYKDGIFRLALGFLNNKGDAEDITQDVFIAVFENIKHFRGQSNLKTWIYRIAINKSINQQKKLKIKSLWVQLQGNFLQNQVADNVDPCQVFIKNEKQQIIDKALNKLPINQRTAFVLHKYDDLPHSEVAQIMNISISAVESLIHRAKLNLQKYLSSIKT